MICWPNLDRRSVERQRLKEIAIAAALTAAFFAVAGSAKAAPRHNHKAHHRYLVPDANGNSATVIGGRPAGCPAVYCGCGLRKYLGISDVRLNLADAWKRLFPSTYAHEGAVAVRNYHRRGHGHVMLLKEHVAGNDWRVVDFNSGHGLSRIHVRSVVGYSFVNPHAERFASAE